jgi:hypothetical protein
MCVRIFRAIPRDINHLRIRVPRLWHTDTIRMPTRPARGVVSPLFSAAKGGFRELLVIRGYRTVTCCEIEACAVFRGSINAARLYAPVTW